MTQSVVVSDTTTLIVLEKQNRLSLLCQLFDRVLIPEQIFQELKAGSEGSSLLEFSCLQVVDVPLSSRLNNLKLLLDDGESAAIELALVKQLPLIIDEKKGRKVARQLGLQITGFSGLLILAVKKRILSSQDVITILDRAKIFGYKLSTQLYNQVTDMLYNM
jgi:predicted nucleic acid-binding protein